MQFEALVKSIQTAGNGIKWDDIPQFIYTNLNVFINNLIKNRKFVENPQQDYEQFVEWIKQKGQKAIDLLKTEKGREKKVLLLNQFVRQVEENQYNIVSLLNLTKKLEQAKMLFIKKYNSAIKTKQFLTQPDGTLAVTAPEGYVAVDRSGNMVKFVSRLDFSAANFAMSKQEKFK